MQLSRDVPKNSALVSCLAPLDNIDQESVREAEYTVLEKMILLE